MKPTIRTFIVTSIGLLILAGGLIFQKVRAQTPTPEPVEEEANGRLRTVSVSGSGQAGSAPDQAITRLGVQTEAETASEALTQNSERMRSLLQALRDQGVSTADIQTQAIQLFPLYAELPVEPQPQPQAPEVTGYRAYNVVEVRVRNLTNLGGMLDAAVEAGGNIIESIRFDIGEPDQLLQQARVDAMQDARQKAEQLAGLADAELGEVLSINETTFTPFGFERGMPAFGGADAPVEPGVQFLQVDVQVTWLIR